MTAKSTHHICHFSQEDVNIKCRQRSVTHSFPGIQLKSNKGMEDVIIPLLQTVKITEEFVARTWLATKYTGYIEIPYKLKWAFVLGALKETVTLFWSSNNAQCCLHRNVKVSCFYSLLCKIKVQMKQISALIIHQGLSEIILKILMFFSFLGNLNPTFCWRDVEFQLITCSCPF